MRVKTIKDTTYILLHSIFTIDYYLYNQIKHFSIQGRLLKKSLKLPPKIIVAKKNPPKVVPVPRLRYSNTLIQNNFVIKSLPYLTCPSLDKLRPHY